MLRTVGVLLLVACSTSQVNSEECDNLGILVYEDLGCKPVKKDDKSCPLKYECDDFTQKPDSCLFRARSYGLGESVDNDLIYETCNVGCHCANYTNPAASTFNCAILDCPEWLGVRVPPNCYPKYELGKCCSSGKICPAVDKPAECVVAGKTLQEGQRFTPENSCSRCVCGKNFAGKFEAPFCKRSTCAVQIRHSEDLAKNCAAGYFQKEGVLCCPDTWICPSEKQEPFVAVNPKADSKSDLTCKFGDSEVKLGQGFERTVDQYGANHKMKCECVVPPLLTCKEQ